MGYHADKPLLYYSAKLAAASGYEIVKITYLPCTVDFDHMREYVEDCIRAAEQQLKDVDLSAQEDVLFLSKSVGTVTATAFAAFHQLPARHVLFTPLEETFIHAADACGIAFSGTKDQCADHAKIKDLCSQKNIPLTAIENANHSLETGDVLQDLTIMHQVMTTVRSYL